MSYPRSNQTQPIHADNLILSTARTAPSIARAFVRQRLRVWQVDHVIEDAEIVVTELATNAVIACATSTMLIDVQLYTLPCLLYIYVVDRAPGWPTPMRPTDEHGRGLQLVAALSVQWGAHPLIDRRGGKVVWAALAI